MKTNFVHYLNLLIGIFLNILGVSFSCVLSWENQTISSSIAAFKKLSFLMWVQIFFAICSSFSFIEGIFPTRIGYASKTAVVPLTQLLLKRLSLRYHVMNSPALATYFQSLCPSNCCIILLALPLMQRTLLYWTLICKFLKLTRNHATPFPFTLSRFPSTHI